MHFFCDLVLSFTGLQSGKCAEINLMSPFTHERVLLNYTSLGCLTFSSVFTMMQHLYVQSLKAVFVFICWKGEVFLYSPKGLFLGCAHIAGIFLGHTEVISLPALVGILVTSHASQWGRRSGRRCAVANPVVHWNLEPSPLPACSVQVERLCSKKKKKSQTN